MCIWGAKESHGEDMVLCLLLLFPMCTIEEKKKSNKLHHNEPQWREQGQFRIIYAKSWLWLLLTVVAVVVVDCLQCNLSGFNLNRMPNGFAYVKYHQFDGIYWAECRRRERAAICRPNYTIQSILFKRQGGRWVEKKKQRIKKTMTELLREIN